MAYLNIKELEAELKKGSFRRIYYIFGGDKAGVETATRKIVKAAVGGNEEFALTKLDGKRFDISQLEELVGQFNMMSEYNCILINDYNCEKPREDMRGKKAEDINKTLFSALKNIPDQSIVIFNVTGFDVEMQWDYKAKRNVIKSKDKNKKLADFADKNGAVCEMPIKTPQDLSRIITNKAAAGGGAISLNNARILAELCLCDELVINSELDKLLAYAAGREITAEMIDELVSRRSDMTVYKLSAAVASFDAKSAFEAIDEMNITKDNRTLVFHAIFSSFNDLYRAACAKKSGISADRAAEDFGYFGRAFVMRNAFSSSSGMSIEMLRKCIIILRDTAVKMNSTACEPRYEIEQAVTRMLKVKR
ncbi:MAG: DNA polymerase III subunit delta [Ruminococcus sp.]|nr:DNA polymerase III subunit delta [Ruminococcus sp.]